MTNFYSSIFLFLFSSLIYCQDISVVTQQRNNGTVEVLAYSPDGQLLATGGKGDHNIKVWDLNSSKIIGTLVGHTESINALSFDKSGHHILSASNDKKIIIWDVLNWTIKDSIQAISPANCISTISDGTFFTGHENGAVNQWKIENLNMYQRLFFNNRKINQIKQYENKVFFSQNGNLIVLDKNTKQIIIEKKLHAIKIVDFDINPNNQTLISAGKDGKVFLWKISDLSEFQQIKTNSLLINGFDNNFSKEIIAISGLNKSVKLFNYSGQLINAFKGNTEEKDTPIRAIKISPDGTTIASSGVTISESLKGRKINSIIRIWDIHRGILHQTLTGHVNPIYAFDFHPKQNKMVFLGEDRFLSFWNLNTAEKYGDFLLPKPKREIPPKIKSFNFDKGKKLLGKAIKLASGDVSSILERGQLKSITTTVLKRSITEKDLISFSPSGDYLLTKLKHDEIRQYDLKNRKPELIKTIFAYQPVINNFEISPHENYIAVIGSGDSAVSLIDFNTGEFIKKLSTPLPKTSLQFIFEAKSVSFSPDGKYLAVCFNTSKTYVWRTSTWQLVFENLLPGNLGYAHGTYVNFTKNSDALIINTFSGIKKFNTSNFNSISNAVLSIKGHSLPVNKPCDFAATISNGYLYFENLTTSRTVKSIQLKPELVSQVSAQPNGKIGLILINGQFFILNPINGEDEIMLVASGDNSIIKTHDNYYKVNKAGYDLVTFRIKNKAYPFEQFDAIYNRPDKVLKKLNCDNPDLINLYYKAHLKRLKKLDLDEFEADKIRTDVPSCKILNANSISAISSNSSIDINISMSDPKLLNSYNVWVNNVPVYGKTGKKINTKSISNLSIPIELSNGTNKIQIACRNSNGIESVFETIYTNYQPELYVQNLYIVTIGTSKYKNEQYNLNYAAKDAKDLSELLNTNTTNSYNNIYSKTLYNSEATIENILDLKSFIKQANLNDIVIVFIAGHGVLDENFDYYFATHNMNFGEPKQYGLSYEALENLIDATKARKKILIMDTCHSGEIDKEEVFFAEEESKSDESISFRSSGLTVENKVVGISPSKMMNELFNDLRRGTGASVLSSAGGTEYALESDEWKNGLFSYCLLSGIKNQFADLNNDGKINLIELQNYTIEKVKALSQGKQIPNARVQNLELDFRVW